MRQEYRDLFGPDYPLVCAAIRDTWVQWGRYGGVLMSKEDVWQVAVMMWLKIQARLRERKGRSSFIYQSVCGGILDHLRMLHVSFRSDKKIPPPTFIDLEALTIADGYMLAGRRFDDHLMWRGAAAIEELLRTATPRETAIWVETMRKGRRLHDVGRDLGLTESRVCQIRLKMMDRLRASLTEQPWID